MKSFEQDAYEVGARYIRLLAAIERAYYIGDDEDVAMLMSSIDPVDVRMVADMLDALAALHKVWAGTTGEQPDGMSDDASHRTPSLALVSEVTPSPPTGPESFSVKVPPPCS